ncbi:MAG: hypothetical protein HWD85_06070 [Flavobacteriaceae bacterium]|nr:hypothetical protein [Flavobacteriaceae bacterium]
MSDLQIQYSKKIAEELGKIAVYLPGEKIEVGDIIKFPNARRPLFGKKLPYGSFKKITSLEKLGVDFNIPEFSGTPDTYRFSSKDEVNIQFGLKGGANLGKKSLPKVEKDLHIQFFSEGAIFLLAIDCDKRELDDLLFLEKEINSKGKQLVWDDTYLVTSVTVAKKAFMAQSKSKSSEILLKTDLTGIKSRSVNISASSSLRVSKSSGNVLIHDWSDNVTVFIDLIEFEKKVFEAPSPSNKNARGMLSGNSQSKLIARRVNIKELINNK